MPLFIHEYPLLPLMEGESAHIRLKNDPTGFLFGTSYNGNSISLATAVSNEVVSLSGDGNSYSSNYNGIISTAVDGAQIKIAYSGGNFGFNSASFDLDVKISDVPWYTPSFGVDKFSPVGEVIQLDTPPFYRGGTITGFTIMPLYKATIQSVYPTSLQAGVGGNIDVTVTLVNKLSPMQAPTLTPSFSGATVTINSVTPFYDTSDGIFTRLAGWKINVSVPDQTSATASLYATIAETSISYLGEGVKISGPYTYINNQLISTISIVKNIDTIPPVIENFTVSSPTDTTKGTVTDFSTGIAGFSNQIKFVVQTSSDTNDISKLKIYAQKSGGGAGNRVTIFDSSLDTPDSVTQSNIGGRYYKTWTYTFETFGSDLETFDSWLLGAECIDTSGNSVIFWSTKRYGNGNLRSYFSNDWMTMIRTYSDAAGNIKVEEWSALGIPPSFSTTTVYDYFRIFSSEAFNLRQFLNANGITPADHILNFQVLIDNVVVSNTSSYLNEAPYFPLSSVLLDSTNWSDGLHNVKLRWTMQNSGDGVGVVITSPEFQLNFNNTTGGPGGGCFTWDTYVKTKEGAKKISELAPGDMVFACKDEQFLKGQSDITLSCVETTIVHQGYSFPIVNVNGVDCTYEHRWAESREDGTTLFTRAENLEGNVMQLGEGTLESIPAKVKVSGKEDSIVYNISVSPARTYFVSSSPDGPWFLVHNIKQLPN